MVEKRLDNENTQDLLNTNGGVKIVGNPDVWELVCKASGKNWMKSTKKMKVKGGYFIQVTSEFRDEKGNVTACAESVAFKKGR